MPIVILPKIEPNMEQASLAAWRKAEGEQVKKGEVLLEIETAKALIEVEAEDSGLLRKIFVPAGKTVPILTPLAFIGEADEPLPTLDEISAAGEMGREKTKVDFPVEETREDLREEQGKDFGEEQARAVEIRAAPAARRAAKEKGVDLRNVLGTGPGGRITEEDVQKHAAQKTDAAWEKAHQAIKETGRKANEPRRLLIIGAGNGGEVVADILSQEANNEIVGFLDDNQLLWGKELWGRVIFGGLPLLEKIFTEKKCTHLCLSITANMKVRRTIYEQLKSKGYHFVNAIHPTAYCSPGARIGEGNIIGAFVYIGYGTRGGDNNLISAHCDIEHHNMVGSHTLFGPGVMTSGDVQIGDCCSLGAGVNIEPHVKIGSNVAIASGSTIIFDLPDNTVIKKEVIRKEVKF